MYELAGETGAKIRYEDIVAGVFRKYPHEFHLKGYPEYPDSGDMIHKPLYDFKKKGLVNAENKIFSLTPRGVDVARQLAADAATQDIGQIDSDRLSRSSETEVSRIKALEGFALFRESNIESLSDSDFYAYLGVSVRTSKNAFKGRLETVEQVISDLRKRSDSPLQKQIVAYHDFLMQKNSGLIEYFTRE
jgi:hypothetical protein